MKARYVLNLMRAVLGVLPLRKWVVRAAIVVPCAAITVVALTASVAPTVFRVAPVTTKHTAPDVLMTRALDMKQALTHVDHVVNDRVEPLARVLVTYRDDERLARRIATALVREARRANLEPDILLAVLLVENPWLDPGARSSVGARGLMQVMPGHQGKWKNCPGNLEEIESNICYGAQIFRSYLREENGRVEAALLRYNGCVRSTNTPNCHAYPSAVFARVGRATLLARSRSVSRAAD
jgi:soluble lytic murein transglycosylase-like protein